MQELTTSATLLEYGTFEGGNPITAVLARSELEAALNTDGSTRLWFELGFGDGEDAARLTLDLAHADLEEMLRRSPGDEVAFALDGDALAGLFDAPDVEAHGLRGALAATVAIAAIAAPTSLAAVPQSSQAAATAPQVSIAATAQTASLAATAQVSSLASKAQVSGVASKSQVSKKLALRGASLKLFRSGLVR
ncbi:MAG: hypothetical protein OEW47_07685 [Thermoleophilia bacterium]|nr:hypothetical protein [Thermoleophilia bacterium]